MRQIIKYRIDLLMDAIYDQRNSTIKHNELYFWTATIHDWKHLLALNDMKLQIIQSLQWLKERQLVSIYAYVIMPNHIHLVWETHQQNGKESPKGSLLKFTAHQFRKMLLEQDAMQLKEYEVQASNKQHEFWQRDPLAVSLYSRPVIMQKIDYTHNNSVNGKWRLAATPEDYRFSSAAFYQTGVDEFGFLTHIGKVF